MIRDFLSTSRQQRHKEIRKQRVAKLIELGWKKKPDGMWRDPLKGKSYSTRGAIELEELRSRIKPNGVNKGFQNDGRKGNGTNLNK